MHPLLLAFFVFIMLLTGTIARAQTPFTSQIVRASDTSHGASLPLGISVVWESVTILGEETDINNLLQERGIWPDSDTYYLIRQKNPNDVNLTQIQPGSKLILPGLKAEPNETQTLADLKAAGKSARLTATDLETEREKVRLEVDRMDAALSRLLNPQAPADTVPLEPVIRKNLRDIRLNAITIRNSLDQRAAIVTPEQIMYVVELFTLQNQIIQALQQNKALTERERKTIGEIRVELLNVSSNIARGSGEPLSPVPPATHMVAVHVCSPGSETPLPGWEICWKSRGMYLWSGEKDPQTLPIALNPQKRFSAQARVVFWARRQGQSEPVGIPDKIKPQDILQAAPDNDVQTVTIFVPAPK